MGGMVALLLAGGLFLGLYRHRQRQAAQANHGAMQGGGSAEDALSVSSAARNLSEADTQSASGAAGSGQEPGPGQPAGAAAEKQREAAAQQQQAAAQQAALEEAQRELEAKTAQEAAQEKQLEEDQLRMQAEKQKAEAAAAYAEKQQAAAEAETERLRRQAAEEQAQPAAYSGPSSGSIVWQGEVRGATLVTINGSASDTGQIVSGALPGVLVMIQPADAKHVAVAGAPAPGNSYRRLTLRIQGKGVMHEVIRWSIP